MTSTLIGDALGDNRERATAAAIAFVELVQKQAKRNLLPTLSVSKRTARTTVLYRSSIARTWIRSVSSRTTQMCNPGWHCDLIHRMAQIASPSSSERPRSGAGPLVSWNSEDIMPVIDICTLILVCSPVFFLSWTLLKLFGDTYPILSQYTVVTRR